MTSEILGAVRAVMVMARRVTRAARSLRRVALTCIGSMYLAGCAFASAGNGVHHRVIHFSHHAFRAGCGETLGCRVVYNGRTQVEQPDGMPSGPLPEGSLSMSRSEIGIDNFPPPALVEWRSADGAQHRAYVDIASLFKEQRVLHSLREDDMHARDVQVTIALMVVDRTISVYQISSIALTKPTNSNPDRGYFSQEVFPVHTMIF